MISFHVILSTQRRMQCKEEYWNWIPNISNEWASWGKTRAVKLHYKPLGFIVKRMNHISDLIHASDQQENPWSLLVAGKWILQETQNRRIKWKQPEKGIQPENIFHSIKQENPWSWLDWGWFQIMVFYQNKETKDPLIGCREIDTCKKLKDQIQTTREYIEDTGILWLDCGWHHFMLSCQC